MIGSKQRSQIGTLRIVRAPEKAASQLHAKRREIFARKARIKFADDSRREFASGKFLKKHLFTLRSELGIGIEYKVERLAAVLCGSVRQKPDCTGVDLVAAD